MISEHSAHSAREVCGSSSWGPDFVSVAEGVYCDMCKRFIPCVVETIWERVESVLIWVRGSWLV